METGETKDFDSMAIPIGVDFERWFFLVRGLKQVGADTKPIDGHELETLTKIPYTTISGNLKFLHQIDFITKDSKTSSIQLSAQGIEFTNALIMQDENKQKEILTPIFQETFKELLSFYDLHAQNNDLNFEMLFNQLKILSKSPDVTGKSGNTYPPYRTGIYTAFNLLIFTGLIDEKFDPKTNSLQVLKDKSGAIRTRAEIPLSCSKLWMEKLFQQIRDMNPKSISREFITANVVGSHHEGSVLTVARFIGLIDGKGNRGENYEKLRLFEEDDFKQNLAQIIKEKYDKIFSVTNFETVERKNLETVFMKEYELGNDQARNGVNVLVNLCQFSNIKLSDSLTNSKPPTKKESGGKKKKTIPQKSQSSNHDTEPNNTQQNIPPSIMYPMPESPFKVNLNINIDVKDNETMYGVIDLVKRLKQEIKSLPELDVVVNDESTQN